MIGEEVIARYEDAGDGEELFEVQKLVRCKDCKKAHMTYDGDCKYCDEWKDDDDNCITVYHDGDFFCGYGERKDDETD